MLNIFCSPNYQSDFLIDNNLRACVLCQYEYLYLCHGKKNSRCRVVPARYWFWRSTISWDPFQGQRLVETTREKKENKKKEFQREKRAFKIIYVKLSFMFCIKANLKSYSFVKFSSSTELVLRYQSHCRNLFSAKEFSSIVVDLHSGGTAICQVKRLVLKTTIAVASQS